MSDYAAFLKQKEIKAGAVGFKPLWMPDFLFPFQRHCVKWSLKKGRASLFEDCGLGKSPQALVWAENILKKSSQNSRVLIVCPLAVSEQFEREADKFGLKATKTQSGKLHKGINVTNYERLHNYNPSDFAGVVVDESSILKNFDGKLRRQITDFLQPIPYRLLCTATPSPNDFMELGTSSEALGNMTRNQMLAMFFSNNGETTQQWTLKGHAKVRFWQWVASWAKACRKPSDLGFEDDGFILPNLNVQKHFVPSKERDGFEVRMAKTLNEQRAERIKTLESRCNLVASLMPEKRPAIVWCHLNAEGDLLTKTIPGAVQVQGSDKDEVKEERLVAFTRGQIKVLVTKPRIAGYGLNWQHCSDVFYFPSHSHEQYYQAIRRCWRFGQKREVNCHVVTSEAEQLVLRNMLRKERQAVELYEGIIRNMNGTVVKAERNGHVEMELPAWM